MHTGSLFSHCCGASLLVHGDVHVDANGGCGLVHETSCSFHHTSQSLLHCFLHHSKLWCAIESELFWSILIIINNVGVPLLYMGLVVPLGFLVNTDNITGNHFGYYEDGHLVG